MRAASVLALLAALTIAACGSSSTKRTAPPAPAPTGLTKAQYIAKANPLCAAAKRLAPTKRIFALIGQFPTPTAEIARLLRETAQIVKQLDAHLSALAPPPADKAALSTWIAQNAAVGRLVSKAAGQVEHNDLIAAIKTEQDISTAGIDPLAFAQSYGLSDCSTIGS